MRLRVEPWPPFRQQAEQLLDDPIALQRYVTATSRSGKPHAALLHWREIEWCAWMRSGGGKRARRRLKAQRRLDRQRENGTR